MTSNHRKDRHIFFNKRILKKCLTSLFIIEDRIHSHIDCMGADSSLVALLDFKSSVGR